jgi:hypothetical protein
MTGTLLFVIVSRSLLLKIINLSDKYLEKIKTHILCSVTFFSRISSRLWDNVGKNSTSGQTTEDNIVISSIQPLGRFWQEPGPNQATGMALERCILDKFLGVVCHCSPLPLDVSTFAARCLHVPNNASAPSSERWNCGWELCAVILPKWRILYAT